MPYKILTDGDPWLEAMKEKLLFGCANIPTEDLPLDEIKIGTFQYTDAPNVFEYTFPTPMAEDERELVLYANGVFPGGEVTLDKTNVSRSGFSVQGAINCTINFIIGYKNDI